MAETASLKRPHEDTEETKETTNGSERVEVRQSGYFSCLLDIVKLAF